MSYDHSNKPKFSIVMPLRDTSRERKFAIRSISSALALNPNEFIIGIDAPASKSFIDYINKVTEASKHHSKTYVRIIQTERSKSWNMHLSHVLWNCYLQCKNDYIYTFNADSVLKCDMLKGLEYIGKDNTAVVTMNARPCFKPRYTIRYLFSRWRNRKNVGVGTYWIFRPHYFEDMDQAKYSQIYNDTDVFTFKQMLKKRSRVELYDVTATHNLDLENADYPWKQFQYGIWLYANYTSMRTMLQKQRNGHKKNNRLYQMIRRIVDRHPILFLYLYAFQYQHMDVINGFRWAEKHEEHNAVKMARNTSNSEYMSNCILYTRDIPAFQKLLQNRLTGAE